MYYAEHEAQPEAFSSIPETMWWGIATLTTVGYGDVYPVTALGKLLGGVIAVIGIGLFALPTGILASGFSEELSKEEETACPHCGKDLAGGGNE
jgi:voltage-gated potassium channel